MKKACAVLMVAVFLFLSALPASAAQAPSVSPMYIKVSQAFLDFTIINGRAYISITCIGTSMAESIAAVTYIEHCFGTTWYRINLSSTQTEWVYTVNEPRMAIDYDYGLNVPGNYRVTTEFTVVGTVESETFTLINYATLG